MKIAIISTTIFPIPLSGYGGLEAVAWERAKGLAKKGHEVTLFAPDGSTCPGVNIVPFGPAGQIDERAAFAGFPEHKEGEEIKRRASRGYWPELLQQDVIIDDSWAKFSYLLKQEGRLKAPILGVMHAPVNTMFQSPPPVEKPCIVCISEDQKNHYEALFSPAKAKVALHGIDLDFYKPLDVPRSKRFLFLARFSKIKGALVGVRACRQAGVGLDLVGDTKLTGEPEYLQEVMAERYSPRDDNKAILVRGPASRGETVWWFSQAHAMIHPIMPVPSMDHPGFREPFGLAPLEAMACGCPVIAGDYGAMRETIPFGEVNFVNDCPGWLVKDVKGLVDAVKFFQEHSPSPNQRKNLRDWVASKFSLQHFVDRWETLCQEAIEGGW